MKKDTKENVKLKPDISKPMKSLTKCAGKIAKKAIAESHWELKANPK